MTVLPAPELPAAVLPLDALPADALPADALPVDALPVDALPVDALPVDPLPADPLPLPPTGWGAAQAQAAVAEAALVLPGLAGPADVVRALSTVVLRVGDSAVKVHPPGSCPEHLGRVHAALAGCPVALTAAAPPVVTSHGVVTRTPWLAPVRPVSWGQTGAALRALHDHVPDVPLPAWLPLRRLPALLAGLPAGPAAVLAGAREALLDRLALLEPVLPPGTVHGDVSPENVLATADGPRWIDLDGAGTGLREYDLAAVVRRHACGEVSDRDYRAFVRAYGCDLRGWPGLALLDALCRLSALGFRLWTDRAAGRESAWLAGALAELSAVPAGR